MNAVEIISLIVAVLVLLKLVVFIINPKWLGKIAEKMLKQSMVTTILILIFGIIVAYFVFTSLTIVQALPAIILGHMILALVIIQYPKIYKSFTKVMLKDRKKAWLVWAIWVVLAVCTLYVLFI